MLKADSKSRVFHCPHCPYTNTNPKLVHGHKVIHCAPQLKCSYCGHLDHYPSRMRRHTRLRHHGMTAKYSRIGRQTDDSTSSSQQSTTAGDDDDAGGKHVMKKFIRHKGSTSIHGKLKIYTKVEYTVANLQYNTVIKVQWSIQTITHLSYSSNVAIQVIKTVSTEAPVVTSNLL